MEYQILQGIGHEHTFKEAKEYFRDMKVVDYVFEEKESDEAIELAFNKKRTTIERNGWHNIKEKMY